MGIANFVNKCTNKVINRLLEGRTIGDVAPWDAPYGQTATAEDIFYCFRLILGRAPNREEWRGHMSQVGSDLTSVLRNYFNSLEFSRRFSKLVERKFDDNITLTNVHGFALYAQVADLDVGRWVTQGDYEPHVTAIFKDRLKDGMHVLDVGANIGYFTMLAASLVKSAGSVMAIEPNADNVKLLEASRRANAFNQVTVVQAAAGREIGLLELHTTHSNGTTDRLSEDLGSLIRSTTVPCLKIDDLVPRDRHIGFIKIDVEAAEYNALLGASALIKRCHPTIVSEFSPGMMPRVSGVDGPTYLQFLLDFGYHISVVETNGSLTACGHDINKVMNAYVESGIDHIDILLD